MEIPHAKKQTVEEGNNILYSIIDTENRRVKGVVKKKYNVVTNRNRVLFSEIVVVSSIIICWALITWASVKLFRLEPVPWSNAFTAGLSLASAVIVYRQWQLARYEISIDKYYDRLDSANKRLEALDQSATQPMAFHIFAEIDKLEYALVKYKYGFISAILVERALLNFESLCRDKDKRGFKEGVSIWVKEAAYLAETRDVVDLICSIQACHTENRDDISAYN